MTNAELFKQTFGRYATDVWSLPEDEFLEWLNADIQQKTGRWIEVTDKTDRLGNGIWYHKCSICENEDSGWGEYKYCPNCGAKMEVET